MRSLPNLCLSDSLSVLVLEGSLGKGTVGLDSFALIFGRLLSSTTTKVQSFVSVDLFFFPLNKGSESNLSLRDQLFTLSDDEDDSILSKGGVDGDGDGEGRRSELVKGPVNALMGSSFD